MTRDRIEDLMIESGLAIHVSEQDVGIAVEKFARLLEGEARSNVLQDMVDGMRQEPGEMRGVLGKALNWWMDKRERAGEPA
jgi:hypothetical protein